MSGQNTSTAVMQRRVAGTDSLDFYPTPPWATRALCEWIVNYSGSVRDLSAWDPACGNHDMSRPLEEYFSNVMATDIAPYRGDHEVEDFLWPNNSKRADWIITNPPFQLGEQFAAKALEMSDWGAALLVRSAFLESAGRFQRLFSTNPPSDILQFTERVVMHHGKLSQFGSTATAYCWLVWRKGNRSKTSFHWIAPCRKRLERGEDYA